MLPVLDAAFFVLHTLLIVFNVIGWIPARTRRLNLAMLLLTFVSWFSFRIIYGEGRCLCTDLHWRVRHAMGIEDHADTYVGFLVQKLMGWNPPTELVTRISALIFLVAFSASVIVNIRDWRRGNGAPGQVTT